MPARRISIDAIRAELDWVNEPVDPNVCGCRHLLCCKQTSHAVGKCPRAPTEKMWSFRLEYFCAQCGSYHFDGNRVRGYDGAVNPQRLHLRWDLLEWSLTISCIFKAQFVSYCQKPKKLNIAFTLLRGHSAALTGRAA
jgi:hypothetical protein